MPPLLPPRGNAMSFMDQLEEESKHPDFSISETYREIVPEALKQSYITGSIYKDFMAPPLAREPVGGGRHPSQWRYKTSTEVAEEGDILIETPEQYRKSKYYHPAIPFEKGLTVSRQKAKFDWITTSRARDRIYEARPINATIASLMGGAGDIGNFIPFLGPVSKIGWVGRGLLLAAEGAGVTAAAGLLTFEERKKYDTESVTYDALIQDVIMGAVTVPLLAALGAGGKAAWQAFKTANKVRTKPIAPPEKPVTPEQTAEAPELAAPTPAPVPTSIPPVIPRVSEVFPEKPPGQGAEFIAPYGTYNLQTEDGVLSSRIVVNDAINQLNDGKDITLSPNSQSIIAQSSPQIIKHLETTRYNMQVAQDIIEEQRSIQREIAATKKKANASLKKATNLRDKIDKLQDEDEQFAQAYENLQDVEMGTIPTYPGVELTPKQRKLIDDFRATQEKAAQDQVDLVDKQAEAGRLRSRRQGYTTKHPDTLQDFDYSRMTSPRDLPPEIYDMLPQNVRDDIDATIKELGPVVHLDNFQIADIKYKLAPHLGRHYAAVYGYALHGSSSVFERFDPLHSGKQTGATSAPEGHWFTFNPGTALSEHYTGLRTVGRTAEQIKQDFEIEFPDDTSIEWNVGNTDWVVAVDAPGNIAARVKALGDRLDEIVPKQVKPSSALKDKLVNLFKEYLELEDKPNSTARQRAIGKEFRAAMIEYQGEFPNKPNVRIHNLNLKNPYVYDFQGKWPGQPGEKRRLSAHILKAKEMGNDSVIFLNSPDPELGNVIVAFKPDQIEDALQPSKSIDWRESNSNLDISWKTQETDLDKAAVQFSKPMSETVKFDKEMDLDNIDVTKTNGVADPEIDRMDIESAKAGMTPEQAKAFDEEIKAIEEDMASDDRIAEATDAVIKCRNR